MAVSYCHLHVHLETSLLDGTSKIRPLMSRVKELGMEAVAMTDHGNLHSAVQFSAAGHEFGVKAIVGCELYVTQGSRRRRESDEDRKTFHLVVLAKDEQGYRNLLKLVTIGHLEGLYSKRPRVDHEALAQFSKGLIALSGCVGSEVPQAILEGNLEKADALAREYRAIFGEGNYYLEVQPHGFPEQKAVNDGLAGLSRRLGIPLVATNDSHYTRPEDARAHDVLLCIQTGATVSDDKRFRFEGQDYYVRTPAEMAELFVGLPEAIDNTMVIAERCTLEIPTGKWILPSFDPPDGSSPEDYLRALVYDAMDARYPRVTDQLLRRIDDELGVIIEKSYATYMLIVADYVNWAKRNGIAVGPGRGSAAGSVVSYLLGITGIDPIFYKLPFERFLTKERPSGPDIDMDFSDRRREEVLAYVAEKYGQDRVARICTLGTMGAR